MQDMWFHYMQTVDKLQIFIASLCNSFFLEWVSYRSHFFTMTLAGSLTLSPALSVLLLLFLMLLFLSSDNFKSASLLVGFFCAGKRKMFKLSGLSASPTFLHHFSSIAKK